MKIYLICLDKIICFGLTSGNSTHLSNKLLVTKNEQEELATNLISLGNKTIIMQERHGRLIILLKELGFNVEEVHNYNTIKEIGFNRCLTCPLERK